MARALLVLALVLAALHPAPAAADLQLPHLERGFSQVTAYDFASLDHVNLFNGNLVLTLPIGQEFEGDGTLSFQLVLSYNSKLWDWNIVHGHCNGNPARVTVARAGRDFNAGMGWRLSLGQLFAPQTPRNPARNAWLYLSADGAEHLLYPSLYEGGTTDGTHYYSRDSTYLRLTVDADGEGREKLDAPNGTTRWFGIHGILEEVQDRFGNTLTSVDSNGDWRLNDGFREVKVVYQTLPFGDHPGDVEKLVKRIELPSFGGGDPAVYTFNYTDLETDRPPGHDPQNCLNRPRKVFVPYLTSIGRPDGSAFTIDYQPASPESGAVTGLTLPTGGRFEWSHGVYNFPAGDRLNDFPGSQPEFLSAALGVTGRKIYNENGFLLGSWEYLSQITLPGAGDPIQEMTTLVTEKDRNGSVRHTWLHYFSAWNESLRSIRNGKFGQPYSPLEKENGRYLSQVVTPGDDPSEKREIWVRYEHDPRANFNSDERDADLNFRLAEELTDYDSYTHDRLVKRSDFDGLGNYRLEQVSATDNSSPMKTTRVQYNPAAGAYPTSVNLPSRWWLGGFDYRQVTQGPTSDRTDVCFDSDGFLLRERVRRFSGSRDGNDLLRVFTPSPVGNISSESFYGGDAQSIPVSASLCDLQVPSSAPYVLNHTYSSGQRATSQFQGANFKTLDRDIDPSTGRPTTTREVDALPTTWDYDDLGRVTSITPTIDQGAKLTFGHGYQNSLPRSTIDFLANVTGHPNDRLSYAEVRMNHMGLVRMRRATMPNGTTWSTERTFYDVNNRPTNVSTWYESNNTGNQVGGETIEETSYFGLDPWGRPDRIELPEGNNVTLRYQGERKSSREFTVGVWTQGQGDDPDRIVDTRLYQTETYDVHGRLTQVELGAVEETNGADLTAVYTYDAGDRLTKVRLTGRNGVSQDRTFSYDGRGFLLSETHPESGTTTYGNYDARGLVGTVTKHADSAVLEHSYDSAGRLLKLDECLPDKTCRPLKLLTYGVNSQADYALGKVKTATRWNYGRIPWLTDGTEYAVPVKETYTYGGVGGRVSHRSTDFSNGTFEFQQSWTYTPLGNVAMVTYPRCTSGCPGLSTAPRTVASSYSNGWLTNVGDYTNAIEYHPSGMVTKISRTNGTNGTNGTIDWIDPDPWNRPMPRNIRLEVPGGEVSLGRHIYDGAGNLLHHILDAGATPYSELGKPLPQAASSTMTANYGYDHQQRIVRFETTSGDWQEYSYDAFGNIQQMTVPGGPAPVIRDLATSPTTNRLTGTLYEYDPRGNLTQWGDRTFDYDALDMTTHRNWPDASYIYTADNERFCTLEHDPITWNRETFALRDLDGRVLSMFEKTTDANDQVSWSWIRDYVYRGDKLLAQETSLAPPENRLHLHLDHLGSVRGVTDSNGVGNASFHYFAYGELIIRTPAGRLKELENPLQFTGHERDFHDTWTADLDYMHARYYSPYLGRFLSVDPINSSHRPNPQSFNRYSYAWNNPLTLIDPDGRATALALPLPQPIPVPGFLAGAAPAAIIVGGGYAGYQAGLAIGNLEAAPGITINDLVSDYIATDILGAPDPMIFPTALDPGMTAPLLSELSKPGEYDGQIAQHAVDRAHFPGKTVQQVEELINEVRENGTTIEGRNGNRLTVSGDIVLLDDLRSKTSAGTILRPDKLQQFINDWIDRN